MKRRPEARQGEVVHYGFRLFAQRDERVERDLRLAEQYASFQIAYAVDASSDRAIGIGGIRGRGTPPPEFHSIFYGAASRRFDAAPTQVLVGFRDRLEQRDDLRDRLMLVRVPKVLQDRERVAWRIVPSFVRLLPIDESDGVISESSEHSGPSLRPGYRLLDEVIACECDRELVVYARSGIVSDDELPDELVESGADVMDVVADEGAQFDGRWLPDPDAENGPTGFRLVIVDEFVGLVLAPKLDAVFDRVTVSVRATELRPNAI